MAGGADGPDRNGFPMPALSPDGRGGRFTPLPASPL